MKNLINTNNMITFTVATIIAITALVFNSFSHGASEARDTSTPIVTSPDAQSAVKEAFQAPASPDIAVSGTKELKLRGAALYRPVAKRAIENTASTRVISNVWQASAQSQEAMISDVVSVKDAISIDAAQVRNAAVGDTVEMALPGDNYYGAAVESVTATGWKGHLKGFGNQYPVLFTASANSVFATITTPQGSYTLEAVNGEGWVYQNPTLAQLSHDDVEDYLIPGEHHHGA